MHVCTVAFGSGREGGTCWKDQRFLLKWLRYRPEHDVKLLIKRWEFCVVVQWKAADLAQLVRAVGTFPVFGRHGAADTSLGLCGWLRVGGPRWSQSQMTNPNALETGSSAIRTPMRRQTRRSRSRTSLVRSRVGCLRVGRRTRGAHASVARVPNPKAAPGAREDGARG